MLFRSQTLRTNEPEPPTPAVEPEKTLDEVLDEHPVPFRGKRCDSGMILYVAQKLSEIHQKPVEEVLSVTEQNARTLFRV